MAPERSFINSWAEIKKFFTQAKTVFCETGKLMKGGGEVIIMENIDGVPERKRQKSTPEYADIRPNNDLNDCFDTFAAKRQNF